MEVNDPQTGHFSLEIPFTSADLKEAALDKNRQAISFVLKRPKEEGVLFTSVFGEHALFTNLLSANFAFKDIKNSQLECYSNT